MSTEYWAWEVTYQTKRSTQSKSLVIAADRDGAKRAVESITDDVRSFETVESIKRVPTPLAEQHFDGYAPRLRAVMALPGKLLGSV